MYRRLRFRLLTSNQTTIFVADIHKTCAKYTCAIMTRNMAATRIPCKLFSDPGDDFVSNRFLTFVLSENDSRYIFL